MELAGVGLVFLGANNTRSGLGPKVSKRIGDLGFEEVKGDQWNWRVA